MMAGGASIEMNPSYCNKGTQPFVNFVQKHRRKGQSTYPKGQIRRLDYARCERASSAWSMDHRATVSLSKVTV